MPNNNRTIDSNAVNKIIVSYKFTCVIIEFISGRNINKTFYIYLYKSPVYICQIVNIAFG